MAPHVLYCSVVAGRSWRPSLPLFGSFLNPERIHASQIQLTDLRNLIARLRKMTIAERTTIEGMSDRRSEIIVAGAVILQEAMTMLGMKSLSVCERSLREGVIVDWMLTQGLIEDRLKYQGSIRERSTLKIAGKYGVDLPHSQRVAELALARFGDAVAQLARRAVTQRDTKPRRRPIRKREAQRQQRRQRREATGETLGGEQHHGRCGRNQKPTASRAGDRRRHYGE